MTLRNRIIDVLDGGHSATIHKDDEHIVTIKNINGVIILSAKKRDLFKRRVPVKLMKKVKFILAKHETIILDKGSEGYVFGKKAWFDLGNGEHIGLPFKNISFATDKYF